MMRFFIILAAFFGILSLYGAETNTYERCCEPIVQCFPEGPQQEVARAFIALMN